MGILDSNRVFNTPKEKRGVVSVDLTKQGVQGGNISVEGVNKFIIKVTFPLSQNYGGRRRIRMDKYRYLHNRWSEKQFQYNVKWHVYCRRVQS